MEFDGLKYCQVPAGECLIGSSEDDPLAWSDEFPQHTVDIPYDYWIARFPVTNAEFKKFVDATSYVTLGEIQGWAFVFNVQTMEWEKSEGASWQHPKGPGEHADNKSDHPVVSVSFFDVLAYLEWLNQSVGPELPGGYQFGLPRGDEFAPSLCCWRESAHGTETAPVGAFSPRGDSHYGGADMAGNVWEWTTTRWGRIKDEPDFRYPYNPDDGREDQLTGRADYRIIRGGSFKDDQKAIRSACRDLDPPNYALNNLGFRVFILPQR